MAATCSLTAWNVFPVPIKPMPSWSQSRKFASSKKTASIRITISTEALYRVRISDTIPRIIFSTSLPLITQYRVLDGNPSDEDHVRSSLSSHKKTFGSAPEVFATDRGFDSADNQKICRKAGIACASIPQRGGQKTAERQALEKTPEFKKAQRFRAGIEGRI